MENPDYDHVSMGNTGHAETIQVIFDPLSISYDQLLDIFFATHNPTTPNRQGSDVGSQYRSAIFYHDLDQKKRAKEKKQHLESSGAFDRPIVTQLLPFTNFYPSENYHKDYYEKHQDAPYCRVVIDPKIQKLMEQSPDRVRDA